MRKLLLITSLLLSTPCYAYDDSSDPGIDAPMLLSRQNELDQKMYDQQQQIDEIRRQQQSDTYSGRYR